MVGDGKRWRVPGFARFSGAHATTLRCRSRQIHQKVLHLSYDRYSFQIESFNFPNSPISWLLSSCNYRVFVFFLFFFPKKNNRDFYLLIAILPNNLGNVWELLFLACSSAKLDNFNFINWRKMLGYCNFYYNLLQLWCQSTMSITQGRLSCQFVNLVSAMWIT